MSKLLLTIAFSVAALVAFAPGSAEAGWVIEGSLGKGAEISPDQRAEPTNVMFAPGYQLLGIVRLQLGLVGELADVENRDFDLQLRPMIGIYPPILPIYGRLILAVEGLRDDPTIAVGGAGGIKFGIPFTGLGIFAEVGVLPRLVDNTQLIVEGRVGAYWAF